MVRRAIVAAGLLAAMGGCDLQPEDAAPAQQAQADRYDRLQQSCQQLTLRLQDTNTLAKDLQGRSGRLSVELREAQALNAQLRARLETVGNAPQERDQYRLLAQRRALENRELMRKLAEMRVRLQALSTTQPATQPAGEE